MIGTRHEFDVLKDYYKFFAYPMTSEYCSKGLPKDLLKDRQPMTTEKKWYAVYTKVNQERKTAELLGKNSIETYCPLRKTVSQWSDRKKVVMRPLFTSYVFVLASGFDFLLIRQVHGVVNFVYWLGKPAVIREEEIEAIKNFMVQYDDVRLEHTEPYIHDTVRILFGPMANKEGRVIALGNQTVRVFLPSLGFAMVAEVGKRQVEVVG